MAIGNSSPLEGGASDQHHSFYNLGLLKVPQQPHFADVKLWVLAKGGVNTRVGSAFLVMCNSRGLWKGIM